MAVAAAMPPVSRRSTKACRDEDGDAEPLDEQVWGGGREEPGDVWVNPQHLRVVPPCPVDAILVLSGGGAAE